jgi:hypothetical protein
LELWNFGTLEPWNLGTLKFDLGMRECESGKAGGRGTWHLETGTWNFRETAYFAMSYIIFLNAHELIVLLQKIVNTWNSKTFN